MHVGADCIIEHIYICAHDKYYLFCTRHECSSEYKKKIVNRG